MAYASAAGVIQRFIQAGSTLITIPFVLHSLGVAKFGIWGAATSLDWLVGILDLGVGAALVSLLPQCFANHDTKSPPQYVAAALFWSGAVCLTVLVLMCPLLVIHGIAYVWSPFFVAGVLVVLCVPLSISGNLWFALQKGYIGSTWAMLQNLLGTAAVVTAALCHSSVTMMVFCAYAMTVIGNILCLFHALAAYPALRPSLKVSPAILRLFLVRGGALFVCNIAGYCAVSLETVVALNMLGPEAAASMAIIMRICYSASGLLAIVSAPLWPGFSDAIAKRDITWLRRWLTNGTVGIIVLALSGSVFLALMGKTLLHLWLQSSIVISPSTYWLMAAWIIGGAIPIVPGLMLNAFLDLRPQMVILCIGAAASFGAKFILARYFGFNGILCGFPVVWLFWVIPAYFVMAYRRFQRFLRAA